MRLTQLVDRLRMSPTIARPPKRRGVGSDLVAVWQVTSGNLGPLHHWPASCRVRHLATLAPPIALTELKATPALKRWTDLRWSFHSQGRAAIPIRDFAWAVLETLIATRIGRVAYLGL